MDDPMQAKQLCVLIPSLEPDERLPVYVDALLAADFGQIVIVNDGSSAQYDAIFDSLAARERCVVLKHEVNRGKGQALRTGVAYIRDHTAFAGVITADADGQHTVHDTLLLADAMDEKKPELLLGSRDFSHKNKSIPFRSRFGNRATSTVFALLYGRWLPDTQTGLRAVSRACFDDLLAITGDRFEYEMNMLIYFSMHKIPFRIIPIETIYLEENKSSHFHPLRDSWRIYKLLLGSFLRFSAAAIVSLLVDYAVLSLLMLLWHDMDTVVFPVFGLLFSAKALIATPIARLCSAPCNFLLNKNFSFKVKESQGAAWRYAALALGVLIVTTLLFGWLNHFIPAHHEGLSLLLKGAIDIVLYFVNYRIQRNWVFKEKSCKNETECA